MQDSTNALHQRSSRIATLCLSRFRSIHSTPHATHPDIYFALYVVQELCFRLTEAAGEHRLQAQRCVDQLPRTASEWQVKLSNGFGLEFNVSRHLPPQPPLPPRPPPPPPSPSLPPGPPAPPSLTSKLSVTTCDQLFHERTHLFNKMWNREARYQNQPGKRACWDYSRNCNPGWGQNCDQFSETYWEETKRGTHCVQDWYAGGQYVHGNFGWRQRASALLGFDADIERVCNGNCDTYTSRGSRTPGATVVCVQLYAPHRQALSPVLLARPSRARHVTALPPRAGRGTTSCSSSTPW